MWLKVIILVMSVVVLMFILFEKDEKDFLRPPRKTSADIVFTALLSSTIIVMMFDVATSNVRHKQNTEKVYAEYEVVDKFTTIKKGEVYYYVELVYIDDYELYDDKDQNIIRELKKSYDYKHLYNKGSLIRIEIKVVIPK